VGRRQVLLDEVVRECNRDSVIGADSVKCFGVRGDFANVEDMVRVRAAVEEGEQPVCYLRLVYLRLIDWVNKHGAAWTR
jgi:hypothetical protein